MISQKFIFCKFGTIINLNLSNFTKNGSNFKEILLKKIIRFNLTIPPQIYIITLWLKL